MSERHEERTDKPGWDTKQRCTCGYESVSRAEQWKHAADALRDQLAAAEAVIEAAEAWRDAAIATYRAKETEG